MPGRDTSFCRRRLERWEELREPWWPRWWERSASECVKFESGLRQNLIHHIPMHIREAELAACGKSWGQNKHMRLDSVAASFNPYLRLFEQTKLMGCVAFSIIKNLPGIDRQVEIANLTPRSVGSTQIRGNNNRHPVLPACS